MKKSRVLGLRYYGQQMKDYEQVKSLAEKNNLSMSDAGKRLVNRGLQHINNPEPLVKEKPKVVTKVVKQLVYVNGPDDNKEHIEVDPKSEQHPSGDKLMTRDQSKSTSNAQDKKEVSTKDEDNKWIKIGVGVLAGSFLVYRLYAWLTA